MIAWAADLIPDIIRTHLGIAQIASPASVLSLGTSRMCLFKHSVCLGMETPASEVRVIVAEERAVSVKAPHLQHEWRLT